MAYLQVVLFAFHLRQLLALEVHVHTPGPLPVVWPCGQQVQKQNSPKVSPLG